MGFAMVGSAKRHRVLIADFAAERLRLGMNFSWATAAGDLDTFG